MRFISVVSTLLGILRLSECSSESPSINAAVENSNGKEPPKESDDASLAYPEAETLDSIGFGVVEVLEREEAFATMMNSLIAALNPIGHNALLVSSEILTLAAIADVSRNVFDNLAKLHKYNLVADAMLQATIAQIKNYADKGGDRSVTGKSTING